MKVRALLVLLLCMTMLFVGVDRVFVPYPTNKPLTDWQVFTLALIEVESEYRDSVVNPSSGARGVIQAMPIFVRECNRLQNDRVYTFEDAYNPVYCIEMLNIINPEQDIDLAIKRHNPKAGKWYRNRIYRSMERIRKFERIRLIV